jgi:hypothetical protein
MGLKKTQFISNVKGIFSPLNFFWKNENGSFCDILFTIIIRGKRKETSTQGRKHQPLIGLRADQGYGRL